MVWNFWFIKNNEFTLQRFRFREDTFDTFPSEFVIESVSIPILAYFALVTNFFVKISATSTALEIALPRALIMHLLLFFMMPIAAETYDIVGFFPINMLFGSASSMFFHRF